MLHPVSKIEPGAQYNVRWAIGGTAVAAIMWLLECVAITATSVAGGAVWHWFIYQDLGDTAVYAAVGGIAALLYTMPFVYRDAYDIEDFLDGRRATGRIFATWNQAFLLLALLGFVTKTTGVFSRGWLVLFYFTGLIAVIAIDAFIDAALKSAIARGHIEFRRLMLIGSETELARTIAEIGSGQSNARVVVTAVLPDQRLASEAWDGQLRASMVEIVARARDSNVDDVVVLMDWSQGHRIEEIATGLMALPVGIHVGAGHVIGKFADPEIARFGGTMALSLTSAPIGPMQALVKRIFDFGVAVLALALLLPVFGIIALLIKLDSPGPVFFRQRRRGYNHKEFRIWKFRTMTTLDDGETVKQATREDARVTPVGRWLRRLNLDELPQLFNVVIGEMSLVGPRPHAVAHDLHFETRILDYPRRLNVKPGITGWAQVHGLRGATETEDDMRRRVEYDIHYIENWSIILDVYIMALTLLSPKAYRNAF